MDELRESSLLFSLESLLETERERVQREAREAEREREEAIARVAEVAERRRVAAQREREARERRQALEQERERLEAERLEAMKLGAVERARLEAESAARLVEAEQARKHQLTLADLRAKHATARYRALSWLSGAALLFSWAAGAFAYFGLARPSQARHEQHFQLARAADAARVKTSEQALVLERRKTEALLQRIEQLQAPPSVSAAVAPTSNPPAGNVPARGGGALSRPSGEPRRPALCSDDGDPLNAELCQRSAPRR